MHFFKKENMIENSEKPAVLIPTFGRAVTNSDKRNLVLLQENDVFSLQREIRPSFAGKKPVFDGKNSMETRLGA
jgi:hypothetical protein